MSVQLNEFGVSDQEVDDWVFKEEAHYHHTIHAVYELISVYGWEQVLADILTKQKLELEEMTW